MIINILLCIIQQLLMTSSQSQYNRNSNTILFQPQQIRSQVPYFLNQKVEDGKKYYLIKWKDYEETQNTWQPEQNLKEIRFLIDRFESKSNSKTSGDQIRKQQKVNKKIKKDQIAKQKVSQQSSKKTKQLKNKTSKVKAKLKEMKEKYISENLKNMEQAFEKKLKNQHRLTINDGPIVILSSCAEDSQDDIAKQKIKRINHHIIEQHQIFYDVNFEKKVQAQKIQSQKLRKISPLDMINYLQKRIIQAYDFNNEDED